MNVELVGEGIQTHSDADHVCIKRLDWDKIRSNDFHRVVVNAEFEHRVDRRIHETQPVRGALVHFHCEAMASGGAIWTSTVYIGSIDKTISQILGSNELILDIQLIDSLVGPVAQEERSFIHVVIRGCWSIDDDTAVDTFPGLQPDVGMIPRGPILLGSPFVSHGVTGSNGTLGNRDHTIHWVCVVLADTMPVDAGTIPCRMQTVFDMDNDPVTPVCKEGWSRKSTVDRPDWAGESIWRKCDLPHIKPVFPRNTSVRNNVLVVCIDAIIAPDRPVFGCIARTRRAFSMLLIGSLGDGHQGGTPGECSASTQEVEQNGKAL